MSSSPHNNNSNKRLKTVATIVVEEEEEISSDVDGDVVLTGTTTTSAITQQTNNNKTTITKTTTQQTVTGTMIPRTSIQRPLPYPDSTRRFRIVSWNLNSLNATLNKSSQDFFTRMKQLNENSTHLATGPSVIFLSETKLQAQNEKKYTKLFGDGYKSYFSSSLTKKGYSGTAAFVRADIAHTVSYGIDDPREPDEGRVITLFFPHFIFVGAYVPNSGQDLKRLDYRVMEWDPALGNYLLKLTNQHKPKPVILGGDLNICPQADDVWNNSAPHIKKQAGCTERERKSFAEFLSSQNRVDAFRFKYPEATGWFSYFSQRTQGKVLNRGMRLDEFIVPREVCELTTSTTTTTTSGIIVHDCWIDVDTSSSEFISDHMPIVLDLVLPASATATATATTTTATTSSSNNSSNNGN
jgi:exodeoxyribonuclease III